MFLGVVKTNWKNTNNKSQSIFCNYLDSIIEKSWCVKLYSAAQILFIKQDIQKFDIIAIFNLDLICG